MTEIALREVAGDWGLTRPCEVRPLQSLLDKLGTFRPELRDAWHLSDFLKINPKVDLEKEAAAVQGKKTLAPLEILSLYSIDPDDGRDQDLFVRDEKGNPHYAYPDQKWFGSLHGGNSQAFRHLEKPPLDLRHPLSTFGFPFRSIGEASLRSEIYFQASLLAFSLGEDYWGWRLLAGSLHYLEDLHNPFHAGQVTPDLVFKGLLGYFSWGRREHGFVGSFAHLVANLHRFFESYVAEGPGPLKAGAFQALQQRDYPSLSSVAGAVRHLATEVRDASNLSFPDLVTAVTAVTHPVLQGPYTFKSDGPEADEPKKFLKPGPDFEGANHKIFEITRNRFESAGKVIRAVVRSSLDQQKKTTPAEKFQELEALLYPTSS